jgi:hypothetical protein
MQHAMQAYRATNRVLCKQVQLLNFTKPGKQGLDLVCGCTARHLGKEQLQQQQQQQQQQGWS